MILKNLRMEGGEAIDCCPVWYSDELLTILNNKGYVHAVVKEPIEADFYKTGRAFTYNRIAKTYQLLGFMTHNDVDGATIRTRRLISNDN